MKTFSQFIAEGGNIKVGDHAAAPFKVTAQDRQKRVQDIHDAMHGLNHSFKAEHGHHLFHDGKAHYAGSSTHLMDKSIDDHEFAKYKGTVGDVDVHIPHEHGDKLHAHLKTGAKFGKYTVMGTKKHGSDVSAVMKHENGEHHQFDFVKGKHAPTEQAFLHSSHWDDVKKGVKGMHHKMLLNAAGGETHKFSIAAGLRSREDDKDPGHQHPKAVAHALFGKDADHSKIHSFHGVAELIKKHTPAEHHQAIYDKFKDSVSKKADVDHKPAIDHLRKTLGATDHVTEETSTCKHCSGRGFFLKRNVLTRRPLSRPCNSCLGTGQEKIKLMAEEAEHHASVIPLVGFSPISHMGHAKDLGGAMKKLPGKKYVGVSQKADLFTPEERSHIMKKQWDQKDVNHHFTKSGGDTIGHAYHSLPEGGKKHLHILVGHDRKDMADKLKSALEAGKIPEMNGKKWDSIHVHTPADSDRSHGMSGTNMRKAADEGNHEEFHRHVGSKFSPAESKAMMKKIKHGIDTGVVKVKR